MTEPVPSLPKALMARSVPPRIRVSNYPPPFAARMVGRETRALGDAFGLRHFGVNLTRLAPGAATALRHAHSRQDELIYVLEGAPTLHFDGGTMVLTPGMCAGMPAGTGEAFCLTNDSAADVWLLEIGDRSPDDVATYPDDDLAAEQVNGRWRFSHKDGRPYDMEESR